jgi:DNA-directed RNA polymerase specialized sigma24 family protein
MAGGLESVTEIERALEGLSIEEIADKLGCATATVTREWRFARTWLQSELSLPVPQ